MRIFKTKRFDRDARREGLSDFSLCEAVAEMEQGTIHANLGGGLFKQRVPKDGQGKSGGWRTLLGYRSGRKAFFLYMFPKNSADNVSEDEKKALKKLSKEMLSKNEKEIGKAIENGAIKEVVCNVQKGEKPQAQE